MTLRLRGLTAPPHTPFAADGALELGPVEAQAAHLARSGVSAVFVAGSTGEGLSLSVEERKALAARWVDAAREHDLTVIVHGGHNSISAACELAAHAQAIGAHAVSCLAPHYFKPKTVAQLVHWCASFAAAAPELPFYYYDIPGLTGVVLPPEEYIARASEAIPSFNGIKYTNPDQMGFQQVVAFADGAYDILWGTDEALLGGLALGARGAVGSTYNFAAPLYVRLMAAFERGDLEEARREQLRSARLVQTIMRYDYTAANKAVMGMLGVELGPARAPLVPLDAERSAALRADLEELGFFEWAV